MDLINNYLPDLVITSNGLAPNNYQLNFKYESLFFFKRNVNNESKILTDLAVLLSTSGTTGSPKLVKLSYKNIQSNAESIAEYLHIDGA